MNEIFAYAGAGTGFVAIVGTFLTKWLDAKLKNEALLREQMVSRISDLETRYTAAVQRVAELEISVLKRVHEVNILQTRLDALLVQHEELLARYKASEETVRRMMDRLVNAKVTPADFPKAQPHMLSPGGGKKDPNR